MALARISSNLLSMQNRFAGGFPSYSKRDTTSKELDFSSQGLTVQPDLSAYTNLLSLILNGNPFTSTTINVAFLPKSLTQLYLGNCGLTEQPDLSLFSNLEVLSLSGNPFTTTTINVAFVPKSLTFLYLDNCGLTEQPDLSTYTNLTNLGLDINKFNYNPALSPLSATITYDDPITGNIITIAATTTTTVAATTTTTVAATTTTVASTTVAATTTTIAASTTTTTYATTTMYVPPTTATPATTTAPVISNICFPAGTLITTDQGPVAIERLDTTRHSIAGDPILHVVKTIEN